MPTLSWGSNHIIANLTLKSEKVLFATKHIYVIGCCACMLGLWAVSGAFSGSDLGVTFITNRGG